MNCYQAQIHAQEEIDALRRAHGDLRTDVAFNAREFLELRAQVLALAETVDTLMREVKNLRSVVLEDL